MRLPVLALLIAGIGIAGLGLLVPAHAESSSDSSGSSSDSSGGSDGGSGGGGDEAAASSDDSDSDGIVRAAPAPQPAATPLPSFRPAEIVVGGVGAEDLAPLVSAGFVVIGSTQLPPPLGVVARLRVPAGLDLDTARDRVLAFLPAAIVDRNHLYRPTEMPCVDGDCRAFAMIGWPVPPSLCGVEIAIGMIDTAVNAGHEALRDRAIEVIRLLDPAEPRSGAMHGTAIAALLVGSPETRTPGLLPSARLVAVEAFHGEAGGDAADAYRLVLALDQLVQAGVQVANLSFAGPDNGLLAIAIAAAAERMVLVAAAGNNGPSAPPAFPAAYPQTIAVTAVDRDGVAYRQAGRGEHVDFAAPGVGVWTAASISGGRFRSGTSFAVPFVTAAIAASLAAADGPDDLVAGLATRSVDLGAAGRDPVFGWGLVNAGGC